MVFLKEFFKDWRVWATIALMGLILWLSSCSTPELSGLEGGKKYTVREGRHDFTPSPVPLPYPAATVSGWAVFHTSCWYDNLGVDNADWNKLAGVYRWADVAKNKNAVILAWRPDVKIRDVFELCMYENIQGANVPQESSIYKVRADEQFWFDFVLHDGKYTLLINGIQVGQQQNDHKYKTVGKISAWFGGNRKAPHTMWLYMNY